MWNQNYSNHSMNLSWSGCKVCYLVSSLKCISLKQKFISISVSDWLGMKNWTVLLFTGNFVRNGHGRSQIRGRYICGWVFRSKIVNTCQMTSHVCHWKQIILIRVIRYKNTIWLLESSTKLLLSNRECLNNCLQFCIYLVNPSIP